MNRNRFIKNSLLAFAGGVAAGPVSVVAASAGIVPGKATVPSKEMTDTSGLPYAQVSPELVILYTNDTHSRIDPFPENSLNYAGMGGVSRRAALIRQIRASTPHILLLDAGGIFQGSAWYQMYGGERSIELMNMMGYDAACPGEQEFTQGVDGFLAAARSAEFPFVCANYETSNSDLANLLQEYIVREFNGIRVGILGLGIRLEGLMSPSQVEGITYQDPVARALDVVDTLKNEQECDYIICLSHLGYHYENEQIDDRKLASRVSGIDLIIGGHTHTFLEEPEPVANPDGELTLVTQAGHSGLQLGRIDLVSDGDGGVDSIAARQYNVE